MDMNSSESGASGSRLGRRALFGAGIGGAAASLLPLLTGKSAATTGDSTTTTPGTTPASTTPAAPTTTAPPRRPTDEDIALLSSAQLIELTARELYDDAIDAGGWSDVESSVVTTIREAHEAAAQSLAGMLGGDAPGEMSPELYASLSSGFRGSVSGRLEAAYNLESALVATHNELLAQLIGTDGATLIAAVQSAEARHGTVLADLNGQTDLSTLLVQNEAAPLDVSA